MILASKVPLLLMAVLFVFSRAGAAPRQSLANVERKVAVIMETSPAIARGRVGFKFLDIDTNIVLAETSSSHFFTPASNAKLYTAALALARLGPDYRFQTQLRTSSAWSPGQDAIADLQMVGGGDPDLSGRPMPYRVNATEGDPLAALRELADTVVQKGIRRVDGDVTGVAARYGRNSYPDGWTIDDSTYSYGAPVSSLAVNDSSVAVILRPTEAGELAQVELRPSFEHFIVQNQVSTDNSSAAHVKLSRQPGTNELIISGTIGRAVDQWREDVAIEDPALFSAEALTSVLKERGVMVRGEARARYEADDAMSSSGALLGERASQPLSEILRVVNKESQNLHAEMVLREVAFVRTGTGSLEDGQKEREAFLTEAGVTHLGTGYVLDDGSGLARQDLTSPDSTVALLRYMWTRADQAAWVNTLPIGGLDGSLQHRFQKVPGAERIRAKTGSLSHVNTLSGYIDTSEHHCIAFSVMVNGTAGHESEVRDFIDRLCSVFLAL